MLTEPKGPPRTLGPPKEQETPPAEPLLNRAGKGRPEGTRPTVLTELLAKLDELESDDDNGFEACLADAQPFLLTPAAEGREDEGDKPLLRPQGACFRRPSIPGMRMEPYNCCSWNKWAAPVTSARETRKAEIPTPSEATESTTTLGQKPPDVKAQPRPRSLEVCAGSGGLSHALWRHGFEATGIDWQGNRHTMKIPLLMKDLTDPAQQKEVEAIRDESDYVHMAPPCGTASEARNIKVSAKDRARGAPQPKPLRNARHPWGMPRLKEFDQMKVDKANTIYQFCINIIIWCCSQTPPVPFTVENPSRSWIWQLPPMKGAIARYNLVLLHMDMCMHGSQRRKRTGILTNSPQIFKSLEKGCDGQHSHAAWGPIQDPVSGRWSFATGQECEYPPVFCDRIAACIAEAKRTQTRAAPQMRTKRPKAPQSRLKTRAQVGHQSKRLNTMCFVPDRKPPRRIRWQAKDIENIPQGKVSAKIQLGHTTLDKGDVISETGFEKDGERKGFTMTATIEETRSPTEFIQQALELRVPWRDQPCIPDRTLKVITQTLEAGIDKSCKTWNEH